MWRAIQRENFTRLVPLCSFLKLEDFQRKQLIERPPFVLNLPRRLAHKIAKGSLEDPILKQFVPHIQENEQKEGFSCNPVGDLESQQAPRLLKKYHNRALLMPTAACVMHCRYCFRRHFDYGESDLIEELEQISQDLDLNEIILSGGDPLSLSDEKLKALLNKLEMSHIKRIRFHTRFPVGIPERIDDSFLALLDQIPQQVWFMVHINHPNELDPVLFERLGEISRLGIPVLNQSVLLKGVNDSVEVLQRLSEELVDHGVQPYYLHQLDRVQGAAHFEAEGHTIMKELAKRLSGYALPRYVKEEAGMPHKTTCVPQS